MLRWACLKLPDFKVPQSKQKFRARVLLPACFSCIWKTWTSSEKIFYVDFKKILLSKQMLISNNSNCLFLKYNPQISISYLPSATALTKVGLPKGTHAHPLGPSSHSSHARSPRVALKTPPSCARRNPPPNFQAAPSTPKLRCSPDPVPDSTLVLGNFVLGMNLTFTSN